MLTIEKNNITIIQQLNFKILAVALRSDGLILVTVKANEEITVDNVIEVVESVKILGEGKKMPLLIVVDKYTVPSVEARLYIATAASNPFATAEAYVVQSLSQKLVGNFYLNFNKPKRPTKIFNSEEKAVEWLKGFL
jgi:hypothetical protein